MDWVQDMTARWMRIMNAASSGGGTPLDEAVRQISAIGDTPSKKGGGPGWRKRKAVTQDASAVTALSRQLIAGVLVSDMAIARLCAVEGVGRELVLARLADDVPGLLRDQQLRALQVELSGSCAALKDRSGGSYAGLGSRVEQLLALAEQQAAELIEGARVEAARITASAGAAPPAPGPDPDPDPDLDLHPGSGPGPRVGG
jgi:hypothetical protein